MHPLPVFDNFQSIEQYIDQIDPILYRKSRNYLNGAVTGLSPWISRGVIDTRFVLKKMLLRGYRIKDMEVFVKELAWRDHWQRMWQYLGDQINQDLRASQKNVRLHGIPGAILNATTGIAIIDSQIENLICTGYMHNHLRMYVSSLACNIGRVHWRDPARWMYYHLLDGDWASNALSWQWVCGTNSDKQYFANQENINHYTKSNQRRTYLDCGYEDLPVIPIPPELKEMQDFNYSSTLPPQGELKLDRNKPILIYTHYNLDPHWLSDLDSNRILWFDEELFAQYPVSEKVVEFILFWANQIQGMQIFVGNKNALKTMTSGFSVHFKEHPTMRDIKGIFHPRNWLAPEIEGFFPSFFKYWKKIEPALYRLENDLFSAT